MWFLTLQEQLFYINFGSFYHVYVEFYISLFILLQFYIFQKQSSRGVL